MRARMVYQRCYHTRHLENCLSHNFRKEMSLWEDFEGKLLLPGSKERDRDSVNTPLAYSSRNQD